jgi:hypothetical protein
LELGCLFPRHGIGGGDGRLVLGAPALGQGGELAGVLGIVGGEGWL